MHFEIPANMVKSQELIYVLVICFALIFLARCGSVVTVTEDEAVQLEFPYPCDSYKVTIQSANRAPFYSSTVTGNLYLPNYQLHRFSVTDGNCSVQVQITPVKRIDEGTYICQAYSDSAIQSRFTRIRLNINYPPGNVSCTFNINDDTVGDWVPLQCTAPGGSLAGGIYCYQVCKRLPPQSKLVDTGETLEQTIWARKEYPLFCCSSTLERPKNVCECKDFVWNPIGDISPTNTIPGIVATSSQNSKRQVGENSQSPQLIESQKPTNTNKNRSIVISAAVLWGGVAANLVIIVVIILISLFVVDKTSKELIQSQRANTGQHMIRMEGNDSSESLGRTTFIHNHSE